MGEICFSQMLKVRNRSKILADPFYRITPKTRILFQFQLSRLVVIPFERQQAICCFYRSHFHSLTKVDLFSLTGHSLSCFPQT